MAAGGRINRLSHTIIEARRILYFAKLDTMKHLLTLTALLISSLAMGQALNFGPVTVELDTAFGEEPSGGPYDMLAGYESYIAYFEAESPDDLLEAIFADSFAWPEFSPLSIDAPCGCWNPDTTSLVITAFNNSLLWQFPALAAYEYDTFWTIGMLSGDEPGQLPTWVSNQTIDGAGICNAQLNIETAYVLGTPSSAIAGDDLRIPIARITTCDSFTISGALRVLRAGDSSDEDVEEFSQTVLFDLGCTDPLACNYDESALNDDGTLCEYPPLGFDCEGNCLDVNLNGLCDILEEGCIDSDACNFDPIAIEENGTCIYPNDENCDCEGSAIDALGVCGGYCLSDVNQDGICDCDTSFFSQPWAPEDYVSQVLLGNGVVASEISFTGSPSQIGFVSCGEALGISGGLSLHTDHALCDSFCSDCLGGSLEDVDLLNVANEVPPLIGQSFSVGSVNDLAVLEFDFFAAGDSIYFDYVFGSDEYLTYVNTAYNDVFGFFLSGPGIEGPYSSPSGFPGGSINLAVVPGSDPALPVTVSSVNNVTNSEFYVDNPTQNEVCINGHTIPMTAKAAVQCGEMYHIRLAIGDGSDSSLETFVVLEAGSFSSENPCVLGCTDEDAWNFDSEANADNGTCLDCAPPMTYCGDGTVWDEESQTCIGLQVCGPGTQWSQEEQSCLVQLPGDIDFDLCVGVPDLLALLVVWGTCVD